MSETITYEDISGRPISAEQMAGARDYHKVYWMAGVLQMKEYHSNGKLDSVIYYRASEETEAQAIQAVISAYPSIPFEIRDQDAHGSYRIERARAYTEDGSFDDYTITELYDAQGRMIYEKTESKFKGVSKTKVRKYCYDALDGAEYECVYDANGTLLALKGGNPPFVPENDHTVGREEFSLFFPRFTTEHPYYATSVFLPG